MSRYVEYGHHDVGYGAPHYGGSHHAPAHHAPIHHDRPYHYDTAPAYHRDTYYGTSYTPHTERVVEEHAHPYAAVDRHYDRRTIAHRDYAPVTSYEPAVETVIGPKMGIRRRGLGRPHIIRRSRNIRPIHSSVVPRPVTRMAGYDHYDTEYVPHDTVRQGVARHAVARDYTHYDANTTRYDVDHFDGYVSRPHYDY